MIAIRNKQIYNVIDQTDTDVQAEVYIDFCKDEFGSSEKRKLLLWWDKNTLDALY